MWRAVVCAVLSRFVTEVVWAPKVLALVARRPLDVIATPAIERLPFPFFFLYRVRVLKVRVQEVIVDLNAVGTIITHTSAMAQCATFNAGMDNGYQFECRADRPAAVDPGSDGLHAPKQHAGASKAATQHVSARPRPCTASACTVQCLLPVDVWRSVLGSLCPQRAAKEKESEGIDG